MGSNRALLSYLSRPFPATPSTPLIFWLENQKFYCLPIVLTENALPPLMSSGNPSHPARSSDSCSPLSVLSNLWVCLMTLSGGAQREAGGTSAVCTSHAIARLFPWLHVTPEPIPLAPQNSGCIMTLCWLDVSGLLKH